MQRDFRARARKWQWWGAEGLTHGSCHGHVDLELKLFIAQLLLPRLCIKWMKSKRWLSRERPQRSELLFSPWWALEQGKGWERSDGDIYTQITAGVWCVSNSWCIYFYIKISYLLWDSAFWLCGSAGSHKYPEKREVEEDGGWGLGDAPGLFPKVSCARRAAGIEIKTSGVL